MGPDMVVQVIDGDTFAMRSGKKVRIVGIDTPEIGQKFHDEARDYLIALIQNKEVFLKVNPDSLDRYGRLLAEVFIDTLNVGLAILRAGLAELYIFNSDRYFIEKYLSVQKYATEHHLGIWSLPPPKKEDYYFNIRGSHRFHRPLCQNLKNTEPHKLIKIKTRNEALELGLSPCRNCRP